MSQFQWNFNSNMPIFSHGNAFENSHYGGHFVQASHYHVIPVAFHLIPIFAQRWQWWLSCCRLSLQEWQCLLLTCVGWRADVSCPLIGWDWGTVGRGWGLVDCLTSCPRDHYTMESIAIQIQRNFILLSYKLWSTSCYQILHIARQHSCRGMCKIL